MIAPAPNRELVIPLADKRPSVSALSQREEASAVIEGYRALHADEEFHSLPLESAGREDRRAAILAPIAVKWGISDRDISYAVGRCVE